MSRHLPGELGASIAQLRDRPAGKIECASLRDAHVQILSFLSLAVLRQTEPGQSRADLDERR
jgi:hypothetical protein